MTITLPDDILREAGVTERDARIELACRLFDADRLALNPAARLAGLDQFDFENELRARGIAIYRPTLADIEIDARTLGAMEP